jgi:hypothetical protein
MNTQTDAPSLARLHQFALAVRAAIETAQAELQAPLQPACWDGIERTPAETADDRAFAVLDRAVTAILAAILAACDCGSLTPARLVSYLNRLTAPPDPPDPPAANLAVLPWTDHAWPLGIPVVGYIAPDPAGGDNAPVYFYTDAPKGAE